MVQPIQAGWLVLILEWAMVKFPEMFALVVLVRTAKVAKTQNLFQLKTVDHTIYTNLLKQDVLSATVVQAKCKAKNCINRL